MPTVVEVINNTIQVDVVENNVQVDQSQTVIEVDVIPTTVDVEVVIGGAGGGGGSGHVIMWEGSALPTEAALNFTGAVEVTDDSGSGRTVVEIIGINPAADFLSMAIWGTD